MMFSRFRGWTRLLGLLSLLIFGVVLPPSRRPGLGTCIVLLCLGFSSFPIILDSLDLGMVIPSYPCRNHFHSSRNERSREAFPILRIPVTTIRGSPRSTDSSSNSSSLALWNSFSCYPWAWGRTAVFHIGTKFHSGTTKYNLTSKFTR